MRRILAVLAAFIAIPASAQNLLWEVSSLTNKVYLFGTIHAGKLSWYPLPKAVEDALADSRELVVEADVTDLEAIEKAGGTMAYQPPDTLKYHVPAKDYERFLKLLPRYKLPESAVLQMKPLVATKPVVELEGAELQAKLMDSLSEAESRALFSGTLGALESGLTGEQIDAMVQAWQIGDSRAFLDVSRVYNEKVAGAAEFEDLFVWSRHEAMLKKIQGWLDGSRDHRFIAVGALHLVGPKGLVEMLRQRGYVVRQVFVAPTSPGASSPGEILPGAPSPGEKKNE